MNQEKLYILDPYNDEHLEKIIIFEEENNLIDKPSPYIKKIRETISKEDYFKNKNEIDEIIVIEKGNKIIDCCYINAEKDIKTCIITPVNMANKNKKRHIPELATTYALNTLDMEEVFVNVLENDQNMINNLKSKGYENLGKEKGNILFLKEKEEKENSQRMIS